jgi:hypothetical protein
MGREKGDSWRGEVNELREEAIRFALDPLRTSGCEQMARPSTRRNGWLYAWLVGARSKTATRRLFGASNRKSKPRQNPYSLGPRQGESS